MGTDGAQIDQPDVIAEIADRHIPAGLVYRTETREVCLLNSNNALGIPRRLLSVFRGLQPPWIRTTNREGCITLPAARGTYRVIHFGTSGVRDASLQVSVPGA